MVFKKISSPQPAADYLASAISSRLEASEKVLWLVTGGSAIKVAVEAAQGLKKVPNLDNLTITLTDERYGDIGHSNSNWEQLIEAGFLLPKAKLIPVLLGKDITTTTQNFATQLDRQFSSSDYKVGLFGMGADGHTSGILPGSPALRSSKLADFYEGPDYSRITTTEVAILRLDEAVLYSVGAEKRLALDKLAKDISRVEQPAQILKKLPKATIFNDYKDS